MKKSLTTGFLELICSTDCLDFANQGSVIPDISQNFGYKLHGWFSYLCKCDLESCIEELLSDKHKPVSEHIHSFDLVRLIDEFIKSSPWRKVSPLTA